MIPERRGPATGAVAVSGAAFGAAAVFLGAGVAAGEWPTGWAAAVCALVATAVGVTVRTAAGRKAAAPSPAPSPASDSAAGPDKTTRTASGTAARGRASLVAAASVWTLAVLAGGIWSVTSEDDADGPGGSGTAKGGPTASSARPAPSASLPLDGRPAVAWTVPAVGRKYDRGVGSWALGSTVAQGRIDGLFAYDGADGSVRWSVPAPTREALCAITPDTEEGIGLVAHGRHEKPCATLLAVRTSDGKVMWQRKLGGKGLVKDALAVGGTTAVTAGDGAVRARSTESGEQRWQRPAPKGCEPLALDADATRTLLVEQCGKGARLLALDTRTGARRWTRDLPVESAATASVVSVSPAVVAVDEADARGTHAFLGFDDKGAPTASVPLSGPEGVLSAPGAVGDGRIARPLVRDGLLITFAEQSSMVPNRVVAYSLKDGRKAWAHDSEGQTTALAAEPDGRVAFLGSDASVTLLDPATGKPATVLKPDTAEPPAISIEPELLPVTGGHVVLNRISMGSEPAAFALR
ncbi:outer membrane protein assembly factor BamB family protein [Streptomyces narbonensis]|uniref:outer membrane protein assembly factor BamB family protein n=1 Tax=Streptomyces narbonensis TaxID=67333 RepID=UPI00340F48C6